MANEPLGTLSLLSWLRRGLGASIDLPDGDVANAPETPVDVAVNFASGLTAKVPLKLVGPGDIVGIDTRVVVRTWPKVNENDAEYQGFPLIEFDQADLPWRYTPASADGDKLRPWISLLVVEKGTEGNLVPPSASQKLAVLHVTNPAVLPDPKEAWAWAHIQLEGSGVASDEDAIRARLEGAPGQFVSRLISPRILKTNASYVACVVPTFKRGRLVGTGSDPGSEDAFTPAWGDPSESTVDLPVYYAWEFQTGSAGSFQQLASLIQPNPIPDEVGRRAMDVSNPGLQLPAAASEAMGLEGALQSIKAGQAGPTPWPNAEQSNWVAQLKKFLNLSELSLEGTGVARVVAPPLYGQWYAAESELGQPQPAGTNPPWFYQLGTDPRARVSAGLGTSVIQRDQEALIRSAREQVGELDAINEQLRNLQLGREIWKHLFDRHVVTGTIYDLFSLTATLHARIQCTGTSVCSQLANSRVGRDLFDPSWRRWTSTWGWIGRRQGRPTTPGGPDDIISRLNDGERPAPEPTNPDGLITDEILGACPDGLSEELVIDLISLGPDVLLSWALLFFWVVRIMLVSGSNCWWLGLKALRFAITLIRIAHSTTDTQLRIKWCKGTLTATDITSGPPAPNYHYTSDLPDPIPPPPALGGPGTSDSADAVAVRSGVAVLVTSQQPPPPYPLPGPMNLQCSKAITISLDPEVTVAAEVIDCLDIDASVRWQNPDPLEPVFAPPSYERPMYAPLAEISKDWIMPGLDKVSRDSAGLAVTNQRFVEGYMVGLNHEMTRELLWNEFPTDQRGTYFRQFWDTAGFVPEAGSPVPAEQLRDIKVLSTWSKTAALGGNTARRTLPDGSTEHLVLVVRAQLIQRYPNVIVYAARPAPGPDIGDTEKHPVFYGILRPDVAFYGFELTVADVKGNPGWYFVLQEQPGEPKFWDSSATGNNASFSTLSGAGAVALQTYRMPFRIGIHGSLLLP